MVIFNIAGYFSQSWQVYAALRFLIGIGIGFYVTVQFSFTNDFACAKWRPPIITTPSTALEASLFALVAWGLPDWKKIHLAIAIVGTPFLFTWWIMPESFRWLITKRRFNEAKRVVNMIAKVNKARIPALDEIFLEARLETSQLAKSKRYSFLDLFQTREMRKITIGLLFAWFGRKKVCFAFYILAGITGIGVGVIQHFALPLNGQLTNSFAILSKLSVGCGWQAMIIYTTEIYPTVVRTIAYGVHSTAARIGGMVAPQIVFLDDEIPGILYFLSGVLMMISAVIVMMYRETKDAVLEDMLSSEAEAVDRDTSNNKFETSTDL